MLINGKCIQACISGYYSVFNDVTNQVECKACSSAIVGCVLCTSGNFAVNSSVTCQQCQSQSYLAPNNTVCISDCSLLNTNTNIYSISSSNSNYCALCPTNCILCTKQTCNLCSLNYILYLNSCIAYCPNSTYKFLMTTTNNNYTCLTCTDTSCQICTSATTCIYCFNTSNLILYNGQCINSCPAGYISVINNITSMTTGVTYNLQANVCQLCFLLIDHCTTCQSVNNSVTCMQC